MELGSQMLIGQDEAGAPRFRVVNAPATIEAFGFDDLVVDSEYTVAAISQSGQVVHNTNNGVSEIALTDLGYVPFVLLGAWTATQFDYYGLNTGTSGHAADSALGYTLRTYLRRPQYSDYMDPYSQADEILRPFGLMPFCIYDDGNHPTSGQRFRFFNATVTRTQLTIRSYFKQISGRTRVFSYYVLTIPTG